MANIYESNNSKIHRIKIKGLINAQWSGWFENMKITHLDGNTYLTGSIIDQAEFHGILARIRDLNLVILTIELIE